MAKTSKNCQSCGMPLKKSPGGGGTNADGTISATYCSYCYENGQFKQPDWTVSQMQDFVKAKMKEMGFPGFLAGFFTKGIPRLERWKNRLAQAHHPVSIGKTAGRADCTLSGGLKPRFCLVGD